MKEKMEPLINTIEKQKEKRINHFKRKIKKDIKQYDFLGRVDIKSAYDFNNNNHTHYVEIRLYFKEQYPFDKETYLNIYDFITLPDDVYSLAGTEYDYFDYLLNKVYQLFLRTNIYQSTKNIYNVKINGFIKREEDKLKKINDYIFELEPVIEVKECDLIKIEE